MPGKFVLCALALLLCADPGIAATITGTVRFEGVAPAMKALDMTPDPGCCVHDAPVLAEALVLGEGQTMGNIFVQVTAGLPDKDYPVPTEPVVLTQKGCVYSPHVVVVRVGQPLDILNPDGILHNVHSTSTTNPSFNVVMPKFETIITRTFEHTESFIPFKCDIHPWMSAYCVVVDHPFFDVTAVDGVYSIEGLDAGVYTLEVTHERLGSQTVEVTVGNDETQTAHITFSRKSKK